QSHLNHDVQLAEELGIRHGDALRSTDGIVEARRKRDQCTTALFGRIVSLHGVTQADVDRARGSRDLRVDAVTVLLPAVLLFVFVANFALSRIDDRFLPEEVWPAAVAALSASLVISGIGLAVSNMWSWIV